MRQLLVCLMLVALVSGQTAQQTPAPTPAPNATAPAPEVKVGPDDTVVTIKGFCADASLKGDACKTAITKAQFEKLADSLQPNMSPAMRRQLASAYSRMLTMSTEAEKRGLDKTPHFEEAVRFARMQILSQELGRNLQTESQNVSDTDIQDYYQKNVANYEQASFIRIFVPHTKRVVPAQGPAKPPIKAGAAKAAAPAAPAKIKALSPEDQEKAGVEAMKKEAVSLRARLIKGEDADKLEKAAFVAAGLPGNPSPTKMDKVRRTSLPADHQVVMSLKAGDVSEVISDPSGNYIYKVVSKDTLPMDGVKTEIKNAISSQRFRDAMQRFQGNTELNDAYFGAVRGPGMPMPPQQRGAKPPAAKPEDDDDRD